MRRVSKRLKALKWSSIQGIVITTLLMVIGCQCALLGISAYSHMPFPFTLSLFCTLCFFVSGVLRILIIVRPENRSKRS